MLLLLFSKVNRGPWKLKRNNLLKLILIYDVYRFELTLCPSIFPCILYFLALMVTEMRSIRCASLHRRTRSLKASFFFVEFPQNTWSTCSGSIIASTLIQCIRFIRSRIILAGFEHSRKAEVRSC